MPASEIPEVLALASDAVPTKIRRAAVRVLGGEALVLVIDRRELHRLNSVGTRIFELCDGQHSVSAIAQQLADEFEVEPETASADVQRFLSELLAVGAVSLGAAP